jgi:hypothetical protein
MVSTEVAISYGTVCTETGGRSEFADRTGENLQIPGD